MRQGQGATIQLPSELLLPNRAGYLKKAAVVKSTAEISVVGMNRGSCAAVLSLPTSRLGTEYYTINWWERNSARLGEVGKRVN